MSAEVCEGERPPDLLVGGNTAINLDVLNASNRDLRVIIPTILGVIFVVLMLLLRSVVAAVLLVVANVISFGATVGVSAIAFNHLFDFPGADPSIPLYAFVFLVALGIDYSIFLMTRVREESIEQGTRPRIFPRIPVRATFDGIAYRGSIASMGGCMALGILKQIRSELGKTVGDPVVVTVERDQAGRTIEVPEDLATALEAAGAREAFDRLSFSHRREHVNAINDAKKPETRARRITKAIEMISSSER